MSIDVSMPPSPPVCAAVAELAWLSGAVLHERLLGLAGRALTGHELVVVFGHWDRLLNAVGGHRAALAAEIAERTDAGYGRRDAGDLRASAELRASRCMSRQAATSLVSLSLDLATRLPKVAAAWRDGLIDQARAVVFHRWTVDLPDGLTQQIVDRLLPGAAAMLPGVLADRVQKLAMELDPEWARRRYERAIKGRRVEGKLNPDGTASLAGHRLSADEVAGICDNLDAIARRLKKSGDSRSYGNLRSEIYCGRLSGRYNGMTDEQVYELLLAEGKAASTPPAPPSTVGRLPGRGLRVRVALTTLAGRDERTGHLLGWGAVLPELARRVAAAPQAAWHYALRDAEGFTIAVGPVRRRPDAGRSAGPTPSGRVEIWVSVKKAELAELAADPPAGWKEVIDNIVEHVAENPKGAPNGDPAARVPDTALRRWLHLRDGYCTFPGGCPVPAHHAEVDHTHQFAHGGPTVDGNLGVACRYDHALRHTGGWRVGHLAPGHIIWISPLGHRYHHRPPPDVT